MSKKKKQLTKSNDKVISGVLGGVAEYFDWDKTITRLVAVVLCVLMMRGTAFDKKEAGKIPGLFICSHDWLF